MAQRKTEARSHADLDALAQRYRFPDPVYVTRPTLPPLEKYHESLKRVWESQWLTNNAPMHQEFERRVAEYLGVEHLSLFCNGTIALLVALQALEIDEGEVITTPFTFPATVHVLHWNGVQPVFCDIEPDTFNLDPAQVERHIGPNTKAILPVHVFGNPCDVAALQKIADRHGLPLVYDAAHAFGVRVGGKPLVGAGGLSVLSFHATKLFSSVEGGAIVASTAEEKQRIDYLKNFGFKDEENVIGPGINGKMNELQAAFGLLRLDTIDEEIAHRREISAIYAEELEGVPGLHIPSRGPEVDYNYAYFPVLVNEAEYGMSRDALYTELKRFNIFARKYFYPLCSRIPCYSELPSAQPANLPVAENVSQRVLCLPIYGTLDTETTRGIATVLEALQQ